MNGNEDGTILLAEDDSNDVFFLEHAFEEAGIKNPLQVVDDGRKAINYLAGVGEFSDRQKYPLPCLMLLDLKLPGKRGLDVLRWIHEQPHLATLIVLVFTSSNVPDEIDEALALGARAYLVKPLALDDRIAIVKSIQGFWLKFHQFGRVREPRPASREIGVVRQ